LTRAEAVPDGVGDSLGRVDVVSSRNVDGESTTYRDEAGRWHGYVSMGLKDKPT
jgi:hypothetical protein